MADTNKQYFIPDIAKKHLRWTKGENKWFSYKIGAAPILDYNHFIQDDNSLQQVSKQSNQMDLRSGRIMVSGQLKFKRPWQYLFSIEYKGLDRDETMPAFGATDIKLLAPIGKNSQLIFGKIKETFSYEMVGDAANLPHQERLLNPFFVSRNIGIVYRQFLYNDRITIAGGWYNNWLLNKVSFGDGINSFTARITGLPKWELNGKRYIHMGIATRYAQSNNGFIRYKGKNESNVSSNYVDTKDFTASHQWNLGIEQLWSMENFSILVEYIHNWTSTETGTEQFNGYYITTSYILSGEQRPYDKKAGYARRVKPDGKSGAWELVGRVGKVNLNSRNIEGGINQKYTFGLNWWATQFWKAGIHYGISNLDKNQQIGITNSFQLRLQWIY